MFDTIIHLCATMIIGWQNYNLLFKMITLDSLFSAIHFMGRFIDKKLSESQIVNETNSLYQGTLLDRYIYYSMIYLLYKVSFYFFWLNDSFVYHYIGLFTIVPIIINKILQSRSFEIMRQKKEIFIKTILAKILVSLIKFCSHTYLNKDANIKYTEIMEILKDYRETVNYFLTVLKSLLVILGLGYVKNYAPSLYYGIIKYIYNYKTGDLITSYNDEGAKHLLSDIIDNKRWNELTKPNTFKAIVHLYQMNTTEIDYFGKFITDFNFTLIKMFSIWTISSLLANIHVASIMAFCFLLYKRYVRQSLNDNLIGESCLIIISSILGHFYENYQLVSFINQFGPKILFNNITYIIIKILIKNTKELIEEVFKNNKETTFSFIMVNSYIIFLKFINTNSYILVGLNLLTNILMGVETKKQILFAIILASSYRSDFQFIHVLFNSITLYFVFGLFDFWSTYTIQDLFKIFLDFCYLKSKFGYSEIYSYWQIIYGKFSSKKKNNTLIFELLDTKKYPSVSQMGQEINGFNASSIRDSVSVDDPIFDLPEDGFMNEISVDDQSPYLVKSTDSQIVLIKNFL